MQNVGAYTNLAVDLDNSLIYGDTLYESLLKLLKTQPLVVFKVLWLLCFSSRNSVKRFVSDKASIDPALLSYNQDVLDLIESVKGREGRVILVSGADESIVKSVSHHLGLFDAFFASNQTINLVGGEKVKVIQQYFNNEPFCYVGDSDQDIPVWRAAKMAIAVNPTWKIINRLRQFHDSPHVIGVGRSKIKTYLRTIRIHQWVKNLLVFCPLLFAHNTDLEKFLNCIGLFSSLCFAASAGYVVNDLADLDADRLDSEKRSRPIASGLVSIPSSILLVMALITGASFIASWVGLAALACVLGYLCASLFYTFVAKKILILDVAYLTGLYVGRIFAGGLVVSINVSFWLAMFSSFAFLSLAFTKRFINVRKKMISVGQIEDSLYHIDDSFFHLCSSVCCALISVFIIGAYFHLDAYMLYPSFEWLWGIGFLYFIWIMRIMILASRLEIKEDPVIFAIENRANYLLYLGSILLLWRAAMS